MQKKNCRTLHRGFLEYLLNTRPGKGQMKFHMDRQKERGKSGEGKEKNEEKTHRYPGV